MRAVVDNSVHVQVQIVYTIQNIINGRDCDGYRIRGCFGRRQECCTSDIAHYMLGKEIPEETEYLWDPHFKF